jgi:hypothetical protein
MRPTKNAIPSRQRIDMTGQTFPCGTVLEYAYTKYHHAYWKVQCPECHDTYTAPGRRIRQAAKTMCPCQRPDPNYLIGRTFERGTVIARDGINNGDEAYWLLECSCPNKTRYGAATSDLISKKTRSCGCIRRETAARLNKTRRRRLDRLYAEDGE